MAMAADNYDFKASEIKWMKFWEDNDIFKFDINSNKPIFSIDTPPPTLSGRMHIGHAFSYAQQDFVARYKRLRGFNVYYPWGTDDNGLPTERMVEKLKNVKSTSMSRSKFVKLCSETVDELKNDFTADWRRLGVSAYFKEGYSTINEYCQMISQASFIDLFNKQGVYRQENPTMWCTECQTAIAQAELEDAELSSVFNDIVFKSGGKELIIATTRPELLPACVAVFYHPDDKRYKSLKNKFAKVPLFDFEVPILEDERADPEKGTGLVMCCTFGDITDIEWWARHKLPLKIVINKDGTMNKEAGKYAGMKIKDARKEIIKDLKEANLLVREIPIKHMVNVHDKCGTEIEFLKTKQWFIRVLDKKKELLEAGNKIKWYPQHMKTRYDHWVQNLQWDWCISRQRFFGVPFPVWYCKKCGEVSVADLKDLPVDPLKDKPKKACRCGSNDFEAEEDVMDTWATSSVTPQIISKWRKDDEFFKLTFPNDLRPQAHDIIRTWAFYTIVKSLYHENSIPWKTIMISGHAQDPHGKKMSKSKGNVVHPEDVIEKFGADALRFWAAGSKLGDDLPFQEKDLVTGQKMITKLWNASKFVMMNLKDYDMSRGDLTSIDMWLLTKLNKLIKNCTDTFDEYEYARVKTDVENFFWHTFCDNYIEIVKDRIYNKDKYGEKTVGAQYTLYKALLSILKLIAPIMPYITEEIYQMHFKDKENAKSIHISQWPEYNEEEINEDAEKAGDLAVEIISEVRKFKSLKGKSLKEPVKKLTIETKDTKLFDLVIDDIKSTTKAEKIEFGKGEILCPSETKIKIEM